MLLAGEETETSGVTEVTFNPPESVQSEPLLRLLILSDEAVVKNQTNQTVITLLYTDF